MNLIIMGPQASGKGTQAKLLSNRLDIPHISSGDLFRQEIKKQTPFGKEADTYISKGNLVPDDLTIEFIKKRLLEEDAQDGFILDGFPRNVTQAKALDSIISIDKVIFLDITDKLAIKRLSSRQQCPKCGAIYGIDIPPKKQGFCDHDNSQLYQREDDKPVAIKRRLDTYHSQTKPILDYYKKKGILLTLDGSRPIEEVLSKILESLL